MKNKNLLLLLPHYTFALPKSLFRNYQGGLVSSIESIPFESTLGFWGKALFSSSGIVDKIQNNENNPQPLILLLI